MNLKNTLFSLAIFGMGGIAGYFTAKKVLQDRYKEDLADVQEFYYSKLQELGIMEEDFEPEEPTDEELLEEFKRVTSGADLDGDNIITMVPGMDGKRTKQVKKKEQYEDDTKDMKPDRGKGRPIINYNKPPLEKILADLEAENDEIEEIEEDPDYEAEIEARAEEFARRRYENQTNGEPYCIDYNEWEKAPEEYERTFLYYYSQDMVLCEDDDSIVDDEEEIVGLDYEDVLSMQTIAWVRNDTLCTLYEIHRVDESYTSTVTNAVETPREREFRLVARRKQALDDR